jgi:hypothetical protein
VGTFGIGHDRSLRRYGHAWKTTETAFIL